MFGQQVQEFMRQVVARKVTVHACGGLITLNLSLITTVIYNINLLITYIDNHTILMCLNSKHYV